MNNSKFNAALERSKEQVEKHLSTLLSEMKATPLSLIEAMRYASLDGGKRFRPFLTMEATALFSGDQQLALETACAIECIHSYSLIHDDLPVMDNDELRRGRKTLWKWRDEATAILTGDALQALGFQIISEKANSADALKRIELTKGLAVAAGSCGMVGGQIRDISAEKSSEQANFAEVIQIHAQKTAALISFAAEAGAIIAGAQHSEREALKLYGEKLGLAFQLRDDLLDKEGSASELGKTPGKDEEVGKATLVAALGVEKAQTFLENLRDGALYALEPFGDKAETLKQAVYFVCDRRT